MRKEDGIMLSPGAGVAHIEMGGGLENLGLCELGGLLGDRLPRPRPLPQSCLPVEEREQITGYNGISFYVMISRLNSPLLRVP